MIEGKTFAERLINWYTERKRDLPWRKNKDPYPVWLSEIILQQTRVEQGLPYWCRFVEAFPTVKDLAEANEEEVLRLWQGLGYYSRARNLHTTAKYISTELNGVFPDSYDEILKLKGVGPYTAAAIASICFDEPKPVVDGNVFRFSARYFGIDIDISKGGSRKVFEKLLSKEISKNDPGSFNQAMMEYGATVCAPKPDCNACVFQNACYAYNQSMQDKLPVKSSKTKVRDRYFHYIVFKSDNKYLLNQRYAKDVWGRLFDFYLLEGEYATEDILAHLSQKFLLTRPILDAISEPMRHLLSHQKIYALFYEISISENDVSNVLENSSLNIYSVKEMLNLPKPKLIVNYLQQVGIK